ncbi:hypothetical protein V6N13_019975 [Hibiscus sabdariffa]
MLMFMNYTRLRSSFSSWFLRFFGRSVTVHCLVWVFPIETPYLASLLSCAQFALVRSSTGGQGKGLFSWYNLELFLCYCNSILEYQRIRSFRDD